MSDFVGSSLQATWFGIDAWRICSVAALFVGYALYLVFRPKRGVKNDGKKKIRAESGELVYTDAPTIRLTDTQRIDRLHKVVSLKSGEQADLAALTFGRIPKLRLHLQGIENERGQDFAHIKIDLGGASAGCGDSVKEINDNSFLVPKAANDEQRTSILYFCGKPDAVSFLQVQVKQLDPVDQTAAIDVLHVRGRWAA